MNLKLDSRSIRVRVSLSEAIQLEEKGFLSERFPLIEKRVEIRISDESGSLVRIDDFPEEKCVGVFVSRSGIIELIAAAQSRSASKKDWGIRGSSVLFEIDRFTGGASASQENRRD